MSEALATLRAIDAINMTLAERMALVLRDLPDLQGTLHRRAAYLRAGIRLADYTIDEETAADAEAHSIELARRYS